jgi:hypothetical protein
MNFEMISCIECAIFAENHFSKLRNKLIFYALSAASIPPLTAVYFFISLSIATSTSVTAMLILIPNSQKERAGFAVN